MDVWRERGSETEREKVRVEAEVEEMQQKKMLSEEEKRRCLDHQISWPASPLPSSSTNSESVLSDVLVPPI